MRAPPGAWPLAIGVAGGLLCILAIFVAPDRIGHSWLAAFAFWIGFPVGALALLAVESVAGGAWGPVLRLPLCAMAATLPVLGTAAVPILIALPHLYAWARPADSAHSVYLSSPFMVGRTILYFLIWGSFAFRLNLDAEAPAALSPRAAVAALILLFFTITYAAIDWIMSLEAPWHSSIYGILVGAGWITSAIAGAALFAVAGRTRREALTAPRLAGTSAILLTGILFLAYAAFMQLLIIWEENLGTDNAWYLRRLFGGAAFLLGAITLLQFIVPFFLLILCRVRRSRLGLGVAAGAYLVGHVLAAWWLVLPAFAGWRIGWTDLAALAAIGGFAAALGLPRLRSAASLAGQRAS